jgi:hypothetical protein
MEPERASTIAGKARRAQRKSSGQVYLELTTPHLDRDLGERLCHQDPRVQNEQLDRAQSALDLAERLVDRMLVGNVESHTEHVGESGWLEVTSHRPRAQVSQRLSYATTDAASCPGDERDAAFDPVQAQARIVRVDTPARYRFPQIGSLPRPR